MTSIVTVVGSASTDSKTRRLATRLQDAIAERTGAVPRLVEVATLLPDLAVRRRTEASPTLASALRAIETADFVLAASPVYNGSYTGLFKQLFDLVDYRALGGVPVALLALGGSDRHALAVEHQFRPLFACLGAATLPTAVFVNENDLEGADVVEPVTAARLDALITEAAAALARRPAREDAA